MFEKNFLHQYLIKTRKEIYIYGTSKHGIKILNLCEKLKINISGFIVTNNKKNNKYFMNYRIYEFNSITNFKNKILLLAFAAKKKYDINFILELNNNLELYYLYISPFDNVFFDEVYLNKNINNFSMVYNMLNDEFSKITFINLINFRITGKIRYLASIFSERSLNNKKILKLNSNEIFVDIGAYNGDTIKEFLEITNNKFKKIYAFESDKKNFLKLQRNINNIDNIKIYNLAISDKFSKVIISGEASMNSHILNKDETTINNKHYEITSNKLDNILNDNVTFIKYDIEGSEMKAIIGSKQIISQYLPKLCISIYHKSNDIFEIPIFISNISKKYKFFIRQIPHLPCWDIMLYCIPL